MEINVEKWDGKWKVKRDEWVSLSIKRDRRWKGDIDELGNRKTRRVD